MQPPAIHGKMGKIHKAIFSLNYHNGHVYLDRCGRTITAILEAAPQWMTSKISTEGCTLISSANGSVFSFSSVGLSISVEQSLEQSVSVEDLRALGEQADLLTAIVVDNLNLDEFSRVSTKVSCTYPARDKEESERWILELKAFEISNAFAGAFGGKIETAAATIIIVGDDRKFRLQFGVAEKQPQIERGTDLVGIRANTLSKNQDKAFKKRLLEKRAGISKALFASLIDVDAYQEDPISVEPRDYVKTSLENSLRNLEKAVATP